MARQMEKSDPEYEYKKAFKIFDKKKDGYICEAELKHVMMNLGEDMVDAESKCEMGWEENELGHLRGRYG